MEPKSIYNQWVNNSYFDTSFRQELKDLQDNEKEIEDRFYRDLAFGTAGMRGVIGAGRNRINIYIVRKASQGFANFLLKRQANDLSDDFKKEIVIAYDSRNMSREFALETAKVMAANGIKAHIFSGVRTTPELSFAVRYLSAIGGVMITASHNPPEYNGYKVYDETGCQLVPHLAEALVKDVDAVEDFEQVKVLTEMEAEQEGLIAFIDELVDKPYLDMVKAVSIRPELLEKAKLKTIFTPLHGTGGETIEKLMARLNNKSLYPVASQMQPDGDFPTCKEPNPESVEAFEVARQEGEKIKADLLIAVDPDCDRIGFMVKTHEGYQMINGNQIGTLFMEYILSSRTDLTPDHYVVNTVVSSDLARAQAQHYGIQLKQTLTGFKFIGEQIEKNPDHFIMGYEESYGYLFAPHVRDKDAVMGTMLAMEMAEYYQQKGLSLVDVLEGIYARHGYYLEETISKKFEGKTGGETMAKIIKNFRESASEWLTYNRSIDYLNDHTGLPASDVLKFYLDDYSWMVLRPSGTEPKLKIYFSICAKTEGEAREKLERYQALVLKQVEV